MDDGAADRDSRDGGRVTAVLNRAPARALLRAAASRASPRQKRTTFPQLGDRRGTARESAVEQFAGLESGTSRSLRLRFETRTASLTGTLMPLAMDPNELILIKSDPYLAPYRQFFISIQQQIDATEKRITGGKSLVEFAAAHEFYGLHLQGDHWVFREWAPNAKAMYLIGTFNDWRVREEYALHAIGNGNWEITVPRELLQHESLFRIFIEWPGGCGDRMPAYTRATFQDPHTHIFSARVWNPAAPYQWQVPSFRRPAGPLLIYETHVGMAQEAGRVGSYREFTESILPRIISAGYTAVQIMAVQEHPYYGSFGYQVSNFFAPSSRFGTPDELRALIDAAHAAGIAVFLDIVHSHAVRNEIEGLSRFDGTPYTYFHDGPRGTHPVWDSRLFNYGKNETVRFLLSNVRYWVEEFKFDGFRFDGVTSMLYHDHGLRDPFGSYADYFSNNRIDRDAIVYLGLANKLAHQLGPIETIAEDVSGLPGLAAPIAHGGIGFDYRLALGIPDYWTRLIKTQQDQDWHVEGMYHELTNRRADERTISYAECHDQALVGDQTIAFRLLQTLMYSSMRKDQKNHLVDRGLALHRLIRLATAAAAGDGYLNFMGNEFGHPEWIDFPRAGNNWSYHYARRQWSLRDNPEMLYASLAEFDRDMIAVIKRFNLFAQGNPRMLRSHVADQTFSFERGPLLFVFNFNPSRSMSHYRTPCSGGEYRLVLDSDQQQYGGSGRIVAPPSFHSQKGENGSDELEIYLPTRTGLVLARG